MPNTHLRSPLAGPLSPATSPKTAGPSRQSPTAPARPSASAVDGDLYFDADEGPHAPAATSPTTGLQRPGDQAGSPRSPERSPTAGVIGIPSSLSPVRTRAQSASPAKQAQRAEALAASPTTPPESYRPAMPSTGRNTLKVVGLVLGLAAFTSVVIASAILCPGLLAPLAVVGALAVVPFLQELKSAWNGQRSADPAANVDGGETAHHAAMGEEPGERFSTPDSRGSNEEFGASTGRKQASPGRGSPTSPAPQPASAAPSRALGSDHFTARDALADKRMAGLKSVEARLRSRQNRALDEASGWGRRADDLGDKLRKVEGSLQEARREAELYARGTALDSRKIAKSSREHQRLRERMATVDAETARLQRHSELRAERHLAQGTRLRDQTDALLDTIAQSSHEAEPSSR